GIPADRFGRRGKRDRGAVILRRRRPFGPSPGGDTSGAGRVVAGRIRCPRAREPGPGPAAVVRPRPDPGPAAAGRPANRDDGQDQLMAGPPIIEIREPGRPVRRVVVDRAIEVGRECDGEVLADEGVSRRHLRLVPSPVALSVVDLGSRNGTLVNGVPITGRVVLEPGAIVRLGGTEIMMVGRADSPEPSPARRTLRAGQAAALPVPAPPAAPVVPRPPSPVSSFWAQVLGTQPRRGEPLFPAYTEMRRRLPLPAW